MPRRRPTLAELDAVRHRANRAAEEDRAEAYNRTKSLMDRARALGKSQGIDDAMEMLADVMGER